MIRILVKLLIMFYVHAESHVHILSDRFLELADSAVGGRPSLLAGPYEKPTGHCFYDPPDLKAHGCLCNASEPIQIVEGRSTVDAVCAPTPCSESIECPAGPRGSHPVCALGSCFLSCHKNDDCPERGACKVIHKMGLCFFPS
ncbi:hypothetical protein FOZ61_007037 [Perkinsus olseni]|uniref:Uncharacterized protein n=1 Tax=Perkinsus olseni TaxID=32597 RepID=A0A7J6LAU7_PEROL|nr:hypothetical protein FOZ61_007037 [Perkinsus olseni]KAF4659709.1 hypothetical protein FOL46_006496 [Perkinsus olseni]